MPQRATILLATTVLAMAGCGGAGTLEKEDLQKQAEAVQSFAAEGALVAEGAEDRRTTDVFVRVHTEYLAEATRKIETELESARASGDLEQKRKGAAKLARLVSHDLDRLHRDPGDRALAARLGLAFSKSATAAEELAK